MLPLALLVLSLIPHLYVFSVGWGQDGLSTLLVGLLAANLLPSLVAYYLTWTRFRMHGIGALLAMGACSCWAVWVGVVHPRGRESGLILIVVPVLNSLLVGPVGAGLGALVRRSRSAANPSPS